MTTTAEFLGLIALVPLAMFAIASLAFLLDNIHSSAEKMKRDYFWVVIAALWYLLILATRIFL